MRLNATTTQEKAWMLRAAYELTRQKTPLNILVNGKPATPRDGAIRLSPSLAQLACGHHLPQPRRRAGVAHDLGAGHARRAAAGGWRTA